jgi:hypothetical protein
MTENLTVEKPDTADFKTFSWVCKGLPRVKPRVNQSRLRDLLYHMAEKRLKETTLGSSTVAQSELAELFCEDDSGYYGTVERVSPAGARLLVRLYLAHDLDMSGKSAGTVSPEVQAYCESEADLVKMAQDRKAAKAAFDARLNDPASFTESEFTFSVLNGLFWRHGGASLKSLTVGGIEVSKNLVPYSSNSGKTRDFRVSFHWTGSDGVKRESVKESSFESNRRNDEERNWGLPE